MEKIIVSVVIPVYNVEAYLAECVESVLAQDMDSMELICVDDGSTDRCGEMLDAYAAQDARVRVIHQQNSGVSRARNAGMDAARGEYIFFLDSDDVLLPGALRSLYAFAVKDDLDILFCCGISFAHLDDPRWKPDLEWEQPRMQRETIPEVCTAIEVMERLFPDKYYPQMSLQLTKLRFLRENDIRFPEELIFEDNIFFSLCILYAKRCRLEALNSFRRRIRESSIVRSSMTMAAVAQYVRIYFLQLALEKAYPGTVPIVFHSLKMYLLQDISHYYLHLPAEEKAKEAELPPEIQQFITLFIRPITMGGTEQELNLKYWQYRQERNRIFHEKEAEIADKLRFAAERDRFYEEMNKALAERDALWHEKETIHARVQQLSALLAEHAEAPSLREMLLRLEAERDALREELKALQARLTGPESAPNRENRRSSDMAEAERVAL